MISQKIVKIYTKGAGAYGVSVIVDNLLRILHNNDIEASCVHDLTGFTSKDLVIPYGVKESAEIINSDVSTDIAMLVDAVSLGYYNKIGFYLKRGMFFKKDFWYSIYAYIRYSKLEKFVCKNFSRIMVVSAVDADYLAKNSKQPIEKFLVVKNGSLLPLKVEGKKRSVTFRVGLLSSWFAYQVYEESNWFVRDYFRRYIEDNPSCELCIAGRGPFAKQFEGLENVVIQGEVDDLNEFFSYIDVFVAVNPKGCGILNRVLDAFAYKTPVLALEAYMSGFPNSSDICCTFTDYNSFVNALNNLRKDRILRENLVVKACYYLKENADWEKNYSQFVKLIKNNLD